MSSFQCSEIIQFCLLNQKCKNYMKKKIVQSLLKIKIYKILIFPVVFMGMATRGFWLKNPSKTAEGHALDQVEVWVLKGRLEIIP